MSVPAEPQAYEHPHQHLLERLALLDAQLRVLIARGRSRSKDLLGFATISEQEVVQLLAADESPAAAGESAAERTLGWDQQRSSLRVAHSLKCGLRLPLVELQHCFALSAFEVDVVVACLAVELDRRYERIFGYLHDDMSRKLPSAGVLLELSGADFAGRLGLRTALNPLAALLHYRIIEMAEEGALPLLGRSLQIDPRIVTFLLGERSVDTRIIPYLVPLAANTVGAHLPSRQRARLDSLLKLAAPTLAGTSRQQVVIYLHGERRAGAETLVQAAAAELEVAVLTADVELLVESGHDIERSLFLMFREALLGPAILFLKNVDALLDGPRGAEHQRLLLRWIAQFSRLVFIAGEQPWHWSLPREPLQLRPLQLRSASLSEQFDAWQVLAGDQISAAQLHQLTSLHPLPLDDIGNAYQLARSLAATEGAAAAVSFEQLQQACRMQTRIEVSSLARRVEPKLGWQDIVLPAPQLEQLRAMCSQARHASIVYGGWCFERTVSLGRGLNVLFSGPPGTGKTMAAEVIASDLKIELLKIDLSQIVSKYIGETEKNLRQLFAQATRANAILLFDEADALLGKRSEVKDAHDRYANTEVAYLLQQMEEYAGISILTTNLRQNIDEAFTRRMRFIVEFPFPEDEDRLRIWRSVWPPAVPLACDVDLRYLARQFRLSGGSIRNIALSAAFLAAEQGAPLAMQHLLHATRREQLKMGRLVNEEEYQRNV